MSFVRCKGLEQKTYIWIIKSPNMKRLLTISILLIAHLIVHSQIFETQFFETAEDNRLNDFIVDSQGDILALCTRNNEKVSLFKIDENNNILWNKTFESNEVIKGASIVEAHNGGYVLLNVIWKTPFPEFDLQILKVDFTGEIEWTKVINNYLSDYGFDLKLTEEGYMISGYMREDLSSLSNTFFIKLDVEGNTLWNYVFDDNHEGSGVKIVEDTNDNWISVGFKSSFETGSILNAAKISESEGLIWSRDFEFCSEGNNATFTSVTKSNDLFFATGRSDRCESDNYQEVLVIFNTEGELIHYQEQGEELRDFGQDIFAIENEIILAGQTRLDSSINATIIKSVSPEGELGWEQLFEFGQICYPTEIMAKNDTVYVMGNSRSNEVPGHNFFLIKWKFNSFEIPQNALKSDLTIVYPNPFHDSFFISFCDAIDIEKATIKIFDTYGREIDTQMELLTPNKVGVQLMRNNLESSMYFYILNDDKGIELKKGLLFEN